MSTLKEYRDEIYDLVNKATESATGRGAFYLEAIWDDLDQLVGTHKWILDPSMHHTVLHLSKNRGEWEKDGVEFDPCEAAHLAMLADCCEVPIDLGDGCSDLGHE